MKKKMKKRIIISLISFVSVIFVLAIAGGIAYFVGRETFIQEYGTLYDVQYTGTQKIADYRFVENGKAVVAKWETTTKKENFIMKLYGGAESYFLTYSNGTPFHNSDYIVRNNIKSIGGVFDHTSYYKSNEYWTLSIYKRVGNKLKYSKVNLPKIVKDYNEDIPFDMDDRVYKIKDKNYLLIYLRKKGQLKSENDGTVFYDLDEHKLVSQDSISKDKKVINDAMENYFAGFALGVLADQYESDGMNYNYWSISLTKDYKYKRNNLMRQKYPEAYRLLKGKNNLYERHALYFLDAGLDYKAVRRQADVVSLLYPSRKALFKNAVMDKYDTKDGKKHVVHSEKEFIKYYKE